MNKRLKELRESRGLSQEALGKCLNVSQQTVSRLERDARFMTLEHLLLYSNFFMVSTDYILGKTDNPNSDFYAHVMDEEIRNNYELIKIYHSLGKRYQGFIWLTIERLFQLENQKGKKDAGDWDL